MKQYLDKYETLIEALESLVTSGEEFYSMYVATVDVKEGRVSETLRFARQFYDAGVFDALALVKLYKNAEKTKRADVLLRILTAAKETVLSPGHIQKIAFYIGAKFKPFQYYRFEEWGYGPASSDIYKDLQKLIGEGKVFTSINYDGGWNDYGVTRNGYNTELNISDEMDKYIVETVERLEPLAFHELVRQIRRDFPDKVGSWNIEE